jgi:hypothetical protein
MRILKMYYVAPAIPLLASGVGCLMAGIATEADVFLWMAFGLIALGLILAVLGIRGRTR